MAEKQNDNLLTAFFALLRAGLWERGVRLAPFMPLDFASLLRLAEEQSVTGLIAAGLEHVEDLKVPKQDLLPFLKHVFALESRNQSMNVFIADLVEKMRVAEIRPVLVKGQGVAQCYDRPGWRAAGDVDLLLDAGDYEKAKALLIPLASSVVEENPRRKHWCARIGTWVVELHGTLHIGLTPRIDDCLDAVQDDTFRNLGTRVWKNGAVDVFLPSPDEDAVFVFTHILQHFFNGGIGLRQLCDWCRLLWTFRDGFDTGLLQARLHAMRLMSEWKAFSAYAVDCLGMPAEAVPLYDPSRRYSRKARRINDYILEVGNFGFNRDMSYFRKYPYVVRKAISMGRRLGDLGRHTLVFPLDSMRYIPKMLFKGFRSAARGE